jgi:predicted HTH transcriptional regulator
LSELSEEGVKYHLKKLQGLGVLERVGSTKAGEWRVLI